MKQTFSDTKNDEQIKRKIISKWTIFLYLFFFIKVSDSIEKKKHLKTVL